MAGDLEPSVASGQACSVLSWRVGRTHPQITGVPIRYENTYYK